MPQPNKKPVAVSDAPVTEDLMPALYGQVGFELGLADVQTVGINGWILGIEPENFATAGFTTPPTLRGSGPLVFGGNQSIRAASGAEAGDVLNLGTAIPGITAAFGGPVLPNNDCSVVVTYDGNLGLVEGSIQGRWKGIPLIVFIFLIVP